MSMSHVAHLKESGLAYECKDKQFQHFQQNAGMSHVNESCCTYQWVSHMNAWNHQPLWSCLAFPGNGNFHAWLFLEISRKRKFPFPGNFLFLEISRKSQAWKFPFPGKARHESSQWFISHMSVSLAYECWAEQFQYFQKKSGMSHVNESCRTPQGVESHIWMQG